jgi:hypothetical protein
MASSGFPDESTFITRAGRAPEFSDPFDKPFETPEIRKQADKDFIRLLLINSKTVFLKWQEIEHYAYFQTLKLYGIDLDGDRDIGYID